MLEEDGERIYLAAKSPTSRLVGGGGGARTTSSSGRRTLRSYGSCGSQAAQMAARQNVRIVKHCVQSGDTLQGIALKYGVTMEDIKRENRLWTTDSLFLREYLDIPLPSRPIAGILDDSGGHDEGGDDEKSPPPLSHFVSGSDTAVTESVAPAEAAPTATTTRTPTAKPAGAEADTSADLKTKAPKAEAEESTKTTTTTTSAETTATATTAAAAGTTMSSSDSTMATAATTTTSTTTTTTTTTTPAAATTKTSTSTSAVCGTAASGKSSSTSSSGCSPGRERRTVSLDVATPTGAVADENIRDFLGRIDTSIQKTKSQIKEFTLSGGDSVTMGGPVASGTDHASQPAGLSHPASTALGSSGSGPSYQNNGFEDSGDLRPQQDQQQQSLGELSTNGGGVQRGGGCGGGSGGCGSVDFAPKTTVVTSGRKVKTSLQRHRREHEQMFEL